MSSSAVRTICRFCNHREAAVEAHIIPRSFFRARGGGKGATYILSNKRKHASTTWTGIYDSQLVCAQCEAGFNDLDRYGYKFFHEEEPMPLRDEAGELVGWHHPSADPGTLKLFVLAVLWRASASTGHEFDAVNLGRWEPEIKRMIKDRDPGTPDRFPVALERFDASPDVTPIMLAYQTQLGDTLCYKMEVAGCTAVTAVQGRLWPERARVLLIAARYYNQHGRLPGKRDECDCADHFPPGRGIALDGRAVERTPI